MPKVSVIIPVYNVEKYLRQCLDSVINQTLKDIEIICVDDGSTDNCPNILDEYAAKDARIKIIHKKNEGYGKAMNVGISHASGEYIGIVEPDDYIEPDMYSALYNIAIETNVDFVKSDFYQFNENLIHNKMKLDWSSNNHYNRIINIQKEKSIFNLMMNTWTGIYKTEFLRNNNIRYNETPGARYQDQGFWFQTLAFANYAYFIDKPFYHYRFFAGNSTNNPNGFSWIQKEYDYIRKVLENNDCNDKNIWEIYYKFKFKCYLFNYKKLDKKSKKENLHIFRDTFIQDINNGKLNTSAFNDYELETFKILIQTPNIFYKKITNSLTLLQKIFSIKNQNRHKIIRILGIKFKIKRKFSEDRERLKRIEQKIDTLYNLYSKSEANYIRKNLHH